MNIKYLNNLAEIIVSIDEGKNIADANIVSFTDRGLRLIGQMRRLGLDVGTLQEILAGMQLMCGNQAMLTKLIDMAHDEIVCLLGKDAWRVYGCDDGGWFYQDCEVCERVAA